MVSGSGGLELEQAGFLGRGRWASGVAPSRDGPWAYERLGCWRGQQEPELGLPDLEQARRWTDDSGPAPVVLAIV